MLHACFLRAFQCNGECSKCHDNVKGLPWTSHVKCTKQHNKYGGYLAYYLTILPTYGTITYSLLQLTLHLRGNLCVPKNRLVPCTEQEHTRACVQMAVFGRTPDEQVHNQPETIPQGGPAKRNLPPCFHLLQIHIVCCYISLHNFKVDSKGV